MERSVFANDSVLNFYPRFGFHKIAQYQCVKAISKTDKGRTATKLNMSEESNRDLVYNIANTSYSFGQISMVGNGELILFYCISFLKDSVYYIPEYNAVIIANYEKEVLEILGIFCKKEVSLEDIIDYIATGETKSVKLYFTPKETDSYTFKPIEEEDTLFILGEDKSLCNNEYFMFPSLSHT